MTSESKPLTWQTYCGNGACIEIASGSSGAIFIRDSKDPDGPKLRFSRDEWDAFATGVKSDYFVLD